PRYRAIHTRIHHASAADSSPLGPDTGILAAGTYKEISYRSALECSRRRSSIPSHPLRDFLRCSSTRTDAPSESDRVRSIGQQQSTIVVCRLRSLRFRLLPSGRLEIGLGHG